MEQEWLEVGQEYCHFTTCDYCCYDSDKGLLLQATPAG